MATKKRKLAPPSEGAVDAIEFLESLDGPLTLAVVAREVRRVDGLSLEAFAARLGVSRANLCDIEKGRKGVSPERAAQWAKTLRLSKERAVAMALQSQLDEAGLKLKVEVHAA